MLAVRGDCSSINGLWSASRKTQKENIDRFLAHHLFSNKLINGQCNCSKKSFSYTRGLKGASQKPYVFLLLYITFCYIIFSLLANIESYKGGIRDHLWAPMDLILTSRFKSSFLFLWHLEIFLKYPKKYNHYKKN